MQYNIQIHDGGDMPSHVKPDDTVIISTSPYATSTRTLKAKDVKWNDNEHFHLRDNVREFIVL